MPLAPPPPAQPPSLIAVENSRPGDADWMLTDPIDQHQIEGYASAASVNRGEPLRLFIHTIDPQYSLTVYRMGWYGGAGARRVLGPIVREGRQQPMPTADPVTGLIECQWEASYELATSDGDAADWLSGIYLIKLIGRDSGKQSYIIFVLRDDARPSDLLFQSSVTTYQAYNSWGGKSTYPTNSIDFVWARKVSFNRPYARAMHPDAGSGVGAGDFLTATSIHPGSPASPAGWEYNFLRWLEREGYDVTYSTDLDTHANANFWRGHRAWLSVGHDEYWSHEMRAHVEAARDAGVGLGFFSSNTAYWQIRLEPSAATGAPNRTMVAYKEYALTEDPYALDGDPSRARLATGQWRAPPVQRPEHQLLGVMFESVPVDGDIVLTARDHPLFVELPLPPDGRLKGLLGYEIDRTFPGGPANLEVLAQSQAWPDNAEAVGHMTLYRAPGGAPVFATGSMQWSWGLDDFNAPQLRSSRLNPLAQEITHRVLTLLMRRPGL